MLNTNLNGRNDELSELRLLSKNDGVTEEAVVHQVAQADFLIAK